MDLTHYFYSHFVSKTHIKQRHGANLYSWILDEHILEAERRAVESSVIFQGDPICDNLLRYWTSRDEFFVLQGCARGDLWKKYTDINQQTSVGTMWQLVNSPDEYAQQLVDA